MITGLGFRVWSKPLAAGGEKKEKSVRWLERHSGVRI